MAELEQELYGLTAKHDAVFQQISNDKYRIRKLPFTSQIIWKGSKYGREIDKIFGDTREQVVEIVSDRFNELSLKYMDMDNE